MHPLTFCAGRYGWCRPHSDAKRGCNCIQLLDFVKAQHATVPKAHIRDGPVEMSGDLPTPTARADQVIGSLLDLRLGSTKMCAGQLAISVEALGRLQSIPRSILPDGDDDMHPLTRDPSIFYSLRIHVSGPLLHCPPSRTATVNATQPQLVLPRPFLIVAEVEVNHVHPIADAVKSDKSLDASGTAECIAGKRNIFALAVKTDTLLCAGGSILHRGQQASVRTPHRGR
mmetsp:Transcript_61348/g.154885  ORF Transcript_61348/g.154885 Transcript_61348/m.154885 type:complete len:228 (+) Transcript_61348:222-905(+)